MAQTQQMTAQQKAAQAQRVANQLFLHYAYSDDNVNQQGTVPSGNTGGTSRDIVAFSNLIQTDPRFITDVVYQINQEIAITVPAGGQATLSKFFPHSSWSLKGQYGGNAMWDSIEMTAFYLDLVSSDQGTDVSYTGLGRGTATSSPYGSGSIGYQDDGGQQFNLDGAAPGLVIPNTTTVAATTTFTMSYVLRAKLARRRKSLWGMVPNGDPTIRPLFTLQMNALVGPDPLANPIQDTSVNADQGVTASLAAQCTVNAVFPSRAVNLLPPGVGNPIPKVQWGLAVDKFPFPQVLVGQIVHLRRSHAMLYEKMIHAMENGLSTRDAANVLTQADYFGLWATENQSSEVWQYDATAGTFWEYFNHVAETYQRQFPTSTLIADCIGGDIPQTPMETPLIAFRTPDQAIANAIGIAVTPSMSTALRLPAGTTGLNPTAVAYDFGFVPVGW